MQLKSYYRVEKLVKHIWMFAGSYRKLETAREKANKLFQEVLDFNISEIRILDHDSNQIVFHIKKSSPEECHDWMKDGF